MRCPKVLLLFACAMLATLSSTHSAEPHIEKIERFGTNRNQVLIHFGTEKERRYELQSTATLRPPAVWSTIYTVPREPFPNHHIYWDAFTSSTRFYRLRVTQ
jgi:hypothetical protein